MHTKEAVIVLLLVLALCRCCVGGPKRSSKDKGTPSSSTGNLFPAELAKAYNEIANNKQQQQQPVDNDKLPTPGNPGYAGVQGVQSVTLTDASGKSVTFTKVEQQQQQEAFQSLALNRAALNRAALNRPALNRGH
uniref:Secreted protein n=1 Tax=Globodera rostochiensis TaxID=31243 RepID=A0A914H7H0_GLORO